MDQEIKRFLREEIERRLEAAEKECKKKSNGEVSPIFLLVKEMCADGNCSAGKTEYAKLDAKDRAAEIANGRGFKQINENCHHSDFSKCYNALVDYLLSMSKRKVKKEILQAVESSIGAAYFREELRKKMAENGGEVITI